MALDTNNNYLNVLVDSGADAQSNLYVASFIGGFLSDYDQGLKVRCEGFNPPASSAGDGYDVRFVNVSIKRPNALVNITRNFDITFRVDANYTLYKALLKQQEVTFNAQQGFTATDIKTLKNEGKLFDVRIDAADKGVTTLHPEVSTLFKFKDCWIRKISSLVFKTGSSNPLKVTVSVSFLEMEDLQTGFSNEE